MHATGRCSRKLEVQHTMAADARPLSTATLAAPRLCATLQALGPGRFSVKIRQGFAADNDKRCRALTDISVQKSASASGRNVLHNSPARHDWSESALETTLGPKVSRQCRTTPGQTTFRAARPIQLLNGFSVRRRVQRPAASPLHNNDCTHCSIWPGAHPLLFVILRYGVPASRDCTLAARSTISSPSLPWDFALVLFSKSGRHLKL